MKKTIVVLALLAIAGFIFCQGTYIVNNNVLNVRSGPGTDYDVIKRLNSGDLIEVESIEGHWAKIKGENSYVHTDLILPYETSVAKTGGTVNYSSSGNNTAFIITLCVIGFVMFVAFSIYKNNEAREKWDNKYNELRSIAENESIDTVTRQLAMQDMNNMEADARAEKIARAQRLAQQNQTHTLLTGTRHYTPSSGTSMAFMPGNTIIKHNLGNIDLINDSHGHSATVHHIGNNIDIINDSNGNSTTVHHI